ncbi:MULTISPECIES: TRAP transporter small permease [Rhodopseudomonas]|uniref:TRAP transporter small permease protein n=1 Tax=Rhodopseudomonas palustris TaxID=1076 RepID=A0A0D7EUU9_RHOPL|nr:MULTISPECIES: TRAP transporter small permease [Rhodopseudomonas]KIZ43187.1 C4-dicarboxylate ABC transporter permease [Rhodopseudomonas palustris]MDF3811844.1 TRAP transporter small permease [Rhodopseudomonas sp. BAL398]WOK19758.1 TRAP transporter small permease [Rhodopseudomonas sp. BAL398]
MSVREVVHRIEEGLIAFILGVMTLLTFLQVVLRYGFNSGFIWALEANFYLFAWLIMIGISYCVRVRAHIGVDAAVKLLPPTGRRVVGVIVVLLALAYAALMIYGSIEYINRMMIIDIEAEDIPVKRWILSICLPLGFIALFIRLCEMGWRIITGQSEGYELADEAREAVHHVPHHGELDATTVQR